ncbi:hypothetical protein [Puia sp.]|jgi:hypothetical protein|uniref:hypothetical protein n=1 Tax=Puia sp. TaxID=2045100 RepID=UPI002F427093
MKFRGILFFLICTLSVAAQDYQAINGSPFAGAMGAANNPASILSTPYPWDLTLFSVQVKNTTNAITFSDLSYLHHGDTIGYNWKGGLLKRYAAFNFNIHLFNARISLGRNQAISFGANIRGYGAAKTGPANYNDSLQNMNQFFNINENTTYEAQFVTSSWLELYGTYSRTIWDDAYGRLNAGITLHAQRGLSGAYAQLANGTVKRNTLDTLTIYTVAAGSATYGYSSNYDAIHSNRSAGSNIHDFVAQSRAGAAFDLGVEYLVKSQSVPVYGDADDYYDYEWKIGASLMDVGANMYQYGTESRAASNPKSNVSDLDLNEKFNFVGSMHDFNDSLATIVNSIRPLRGHFLIWNPARLILNVDRPLPEHFALNTELTLNLGGNNKGRRLFTKEITLFAVTPRWETKNLGGYLPVTVTTNGKVWVGGAAKLGPLLFGVHNWATVFSKTKAQNGGFYLALVIRPGSKGFRSREPKEYTCPKY